MPEHLPPGVYIEEATYRPRPIEGLSTSVAGFVGPTHCCPVDHTPKALTSFTAFERAYGGLSPLKGKSGETPNYIAHAARAFFENGGKQLYIAPLAEGSGAEAYAGTEGSNSTRSTGLKALEAIEDISIVAAPGATVGRSDADSAAIAELLINHCEQMRYRFAVLDPPQGLTIDAALSYRARFDSNYAALYYPWLQVEDPITGVDIHLPPSGFIAGLFAQNDTSRGIAKAPAGLPVRLANGIERHLSQAESNILNNEGFNCLRFFDGRGYLVWGARTISSDSTWKYVNLRRYFIYLEQSIAHGLQWVVFEQNNEQLWSTVRSTVDSFLHGEWRAGAFVGTTPQQAFFVRCDRSTMSQSDIDNGRLVCEIGIAALKPAEFVLFRIGQWTAGY